MKKYLLLLAAGAIALPGLAIADAHVASESMEDANASMAEDKAVASSPVYSQSFSGQVRVEHTRSTSDGVSTASNSLGGDDTFVKWNHNYSGGAGTMSAFVTFQPSGEWRYGAEGEATDAAGVWTASGKGEWDFDMTNTSSTDAEETAYRDVFIKLANASGLYFQLGNAQYGDQMKGYSNSNGGGLSRGGTDSSGEAVDTLADNVLQNGDYDGSAYFMADEARFKALQIGFATSGGLDASLALQMDTDAALFGAYSNDAAKNVTTEAVEGVDDDPDTPEDETVEAVEEVSETTTQSTNGYMFQLKYSTKNDQNKTALDVVLNRYDGSVEDADTDVTGTSADGKAEASATQLGISYNLGMFTPFFNMLMASVDQTTDAGVTTTTDAQVMNLGTVVSLPSSDVVNVSYTTTSAESGDVEESGSAYELQYTTKIAGVAINAGYGSGEYDDDNDATEDDDDSYISVRLQYSF